MVLILEEMMQVRQTSETDFDAMWNIFQSVLATGDTLPFASDTSKDFFRAQWMGDDNNSYVALENGDVLGMYKMGANYTGLGNHVASATYLVSPSAQGKGVGGALVKHSLAQAASAGFLAMQFNYVVSTNLAAVHLYKKLGFSIVGTLPKAFRHQQLGLVDAFVMHRFLDSPGTS